MAKDKRVFWAVHSFPEQLKRRFKAWAAAQGMTLAGALEYAIAKLLREDKKEK